MMRGLSRVFRGFNLAPSDGFEIKNCDRLQKLIFYSVWWSLFWVLGSDVFYGRGTATGMLTQGYRGVLSCSTESLENSWKLPR